MHKKTTDNSWTWTGDQLVMLTIRSLPRTNAT